MPHSRVPNWLVVVFLVAALIGFADAVFLTAEHIRGVVPPCTLLNGCERVLTSQYATIGPIPTAVLGLLYYGLVVILLVAYFDVWNRRILHAACLLVSAGFLASLYFIYVQVYIIGALCPYCLVSAAMSAIMFGLAIRIMRID